MAFTKEEITIICENRFYKVVSPLLEELHSLYSRPNATPQEKVESNVRFPKTCKNCGKVYKSKSDFIANTDSISGKSDNVCYKINGETRIFLYRNCNPPCLSTLSYTMDERRDMTPAGIRIRELFDEVHKIIMDKTQLAFGTSHSLTLFLFRAIRNDGLTPNEASEVLIEDTKLLRFKGYEGERWEVEELPPPRNAG